MKTPLAVMIATIILSTLVLTSCQQQDHPLLDDLVAMEQPSYEGREPSDQRIEELRADIARLENDFEELSQTARDTSSAYRLLALQYVQYRMYGLALEALEEALAITPENTAILYLAGVSAARLAKSRPTDAEEATLLTRAERYYRRAVELDGRYVNALYALAVLYAFELDNSSGAREIIDTLLAIRPDNVDALFIHARVQIMEGRFAEAAETYQSIERVADDAAIRQRARENRQEVLGGTR